MKIEDKERNLFRLGHICDCIEKVVFLSHKLHNYDNFEKQWIEQDALIRNLQIIGEASVNITDELKAQYPDVAWKEMRGMRNFVTHQYFGVELNDIWSTVVNDIPILKTQIDEIIDDLKNTQKIKNLL
ncbi:MAG: DUF86 domain-containing protein [Dysgonamonadaceae bacterium]|jgi:uncharacterized protein with HEPN domain|nr:DUF86 domain-containing protein [Dysgonamonadaceae bacterium]